MGILGLPCALQLVHEGNRNIYFPPSSSTAVQRKKEGAKPSPAAMGVTITDLTFMHAVTTQGEKDKAAYVKIKGQMTSLQTERNNLRNELEKERGDKLRLMKETDRGTLEHQVVEWTARAKTSEDKCKAISKASEEMQKRDRTICVAFYLLFRLPFFLNYIKF